MSGARDRAVTAGAGAADPHLAPGRRRREESTRRLDALDGLRTVAVGLVILFHVSVPRMSAGYLGVDIFFVLSGFLITSGLLRSAIDTGSIRLLGFYHRRVKRLLLAALLVIGAVLVWTALAEPVFRTGTIATDAWYTIFYLANWRLISSSSYFESDGTTSPLLHMWSLAVEEQFYLVWPLLLVVLLWAFRNKVTSPRQLGLAVGGLAAVAASVSIVLLWVLYDPMAPDRAYMGTDTKVFEPLIGAVLAVALREPPLRAAVARHARPILWIGGLAMVALFAVLDGPAPFYFQGGAALFSLACAAVIGALAVAPATPEARLLAWEPMAYLGRISYGLYLWHWPIALQFGVHTGEFTPVRALAVIVLTVLLAAASYHWIEMPIRRGALGRMLPPRRTLIAGATAMAMAAVGASVVGTTPLTTLVIPGIAAAAIKTDNVLIVGDSVPNRLMSSLAEVGSERGLTVVSAAQGACTPLGVALDFGANDDSGALCPGVIETQEQMLVEYTPGTVIWWSRYEIADRVIDGEIVTPEEDLFWEALHADLERAVDRLTAGGARLVIVLTERPGLGMMSRDEAALATPLIQRLINGDGFRIRYNELVLELASSDTRVSTIDGDAIFCSDEPSAGGLCDDSVGERGFMRYDGSHETTEEFGREVATAILDGALEGNLVP